MKMSEYLNKIVRRLTELKHVAGSFGRELCEKAFVCFGRLTASVKHGLRYALQYKDMVGYYAVLAIVLIALSAAAYDYRGRKNERTMMDVDCPQDSGIAVQMQTDPTISPEQQIESEKFILPVNGQLIGAFSDEKPVWSTTMQLWQTHPALDISASIGETVAAAADGEVLDTYSDALWGNTVVIDHGNGRIVKYASLNTLEIVSIGEKVKRGDVIGSVGICAAEAKLGAHIHLEYLDQEQPADFALLLSESDRENLRE